LWGALHLHCNTLQHTATHCNTLQHTATHCNTLQHTATHCNTLQTCVVNTCVVRCCAQHVCCPTLCVVRLNRHMRFKDNIHQVQSTSWDWIEAIWLQFSHMCKELLATRSFLLYEYDTGDRPYLMCCEGRTTYIQCKAPHEIDAPYQATRSFLHIHLMYVVLPSQHMRFNLMRKAPHKLCTSYGDSISWGALTYVVIYIVLHVLWICCRRCVVKNRHICVVLEEA